MNFTDKIVLVTGSSRGIGKQIAEMFAKLGAYVIINSYNNITQLVETYEDMKANNLQVSYYQADLSNYEQCVDLYDFILQTTGRYPDILINNTGISYTNLFTDTTPDMWHKIIATNLNSAYYCSYLAVPHMIRQHSGCIINISSIWGNVGASCEVAYSTTKSGLNGFTKALAKELGPSNVRVNAIACGWIDTDMNNMYATEERADFIEGVPLMRTGSVTDVGNLCMFLASSDASYINGQIVTLDGGMT
ncbi:MAG: short-chain dehydrogenase [Epulopiscium sp. Nele67-Bin004]|nr:MAG: short-chain dehydrogenase [Epulopiscium sp. Nele67-Bin004]